MRHAGLRLVLAFPPVLAISSLSVAPEPSLAPETRPYVMAIGSPMLRFADALPPLDLSIRQPGGAPVPPPAKPTEHPEAQAIAEPAPIPLPEAYVEIGAPVVKNAAPPPILPDDTRPKVRPEDFLPYFQFPAAHPGDATVIVPATLTPPTPGTQLPSTATYRQQ